MLCGNAPTSLDGDERRPRGVAAAIRASAAASLVGRVRLAMRSLCFRPTGGGGKSRRRGCGTQDSHARWLNTDVCGLVTATFVYCIIGFCGFGFMTGIVWPWFGLSAWGVFHTVAWTLLAALAVASHMRTMMSNPGAVPFHAKPTDPAFYARDCARCNNFKPPRAHHCSLCNRCIIKMDHHCPWVNNCVGISNQKYFLQFLGYTFSIAVYGLVVIGLRVMSCLHAGGGGDGAARMRAAVAAGRGGGAALVPPAEVVRLESGGGGAAVVAAVGGGGAIGRGDPTCADFTAMGGVLVLLTALLAVLFALFTACMAGEQLTGIVSGETQIDRWKSSSVGGAAPAADAPQPSLRTSLEEVFGGDGRPSLSWLLPTAIVYRNPEALTGFCFRDVPRPRTLAEMENA